ncbi:PHB depolymerase family esterase [Bosea sp. 117]|uniref:alpha/beta hydrolase family esterase n=1 Tax=Bosea sp. 117 TaxID=1125973 RepID=UPI000AF89ED6|nr:PHB depolymerase family esterase [Bosea sp. 117]
MTHPESPMPPRPPRRRWRRFALGLALLAGLFAGLAAWRDRAAADGLEHGTLNFGGAARSYYLYRPARLPAGTPAPAVIVLHGGLGNGERVAKQSRITDYADRLGFVAVLPEAAGTQWNDGRETTAGNADDVGFISALIDSLVKKGTVDPARVFAIGVSNGGMMAQRLACDTGRLAAVAAIVANMPSALMRRCSPARPVPIVFFLSTADPIMPFNGGDVTTFAGRGAGGAVASAGQTVDFWARANQCGPERSSRLPDRVDDGTHVVQHDFSQCRAGAEVRFFEVIGGGHNWPGLGRSTPFTGTATQDVDGTQASLDFFRAHGL